MNRFVYLLFIFLFIFSNNIYSQSFCEQCVEQNGFYCGDNPANWTAYSPNGCVPNGLNGLFYLNDGYSDCVNGADELNATPTSNCGDDNSTLSSCEQCAESGGFYCGDDESNWTQ